MRGTHGLYFIKVLPLRSGSPANWSVRDSNLDPLHSAFRRVSDLKLTMSACFGSGRKSKNADTQPLLPRYEDDTDLQRRLHQKLHTYQMIRALSNGFMPSTEQAIINLRTLLASDVLNPTLKDLSQSGRRLVRNCRDWLKQFIVLLQNKASDDQIQDFIWLMTNSRISVDIDDLSQQASKAKVKADASASKTHPLPSPDSDADADVAL